MLIPHAWFDSNVLDLIFMDPLHYKHLKGQTLGSGVQQLIKLQALGPKTLKWTISCTNQKDGKDLSFIPSNDAPSTKKLRSKA